MRKTGLKTRLLGCVAVAVAVGWASPAGATASIGVMFPDNPPVNITVPPAPTPLSLDQTFTSSGGTGHAIIEDGPSKMILAGEVQATTPFSGATLFEELKDVLHFHNLVGPTPITFHFLVDGTVLVPVTMISDLAVFNNAFISPGVTMNITADSCQGVPFPHCFQVPVNTPAHVSLDLAGTVTETNPVPQAIDLEMQLSAIDGSQLDFLDVLDPRLVIDLPPGVSVTSDGGFSAVGPAPGVPEPSSALLLAAGLGLLAAAQRRVQAFFVDAIALVAAIAAC